MPTRVQSLLTALCFTLSLLVQVGEAAACVGGGVDDVTHHAGHQSMPAMDMPAQPSVGGDCCQDSAHCPMQACFTGAALTCDSEFPQLPPPASLLPPVPVKAVTKACFRFERPPIFA